MTLSIHTVRSLADVVGPAVDFLSRPTDDLFATPRIVVPHAGAKAWLAAKLAGELGARRRGDRSLGDGIVTNVEISFPGTIPALLQPPRDATRPDPWSFDRLMFAVLQVITGPGAAGLEIPFDIAANPLLTARRIAGLFDEYHVRRPGMIREWELGNPVLAPTANDEQKAGEAMSASLREGDRWQFGVWQAVRNLLGQDQLPPPLRESVEHQPSRERLLIAGLESLSLPQLTCLEQLGTICEVVAILVHPSPGLRAIWARTGQQPLEEKLRDRPLQRRRDPEFPPGIDPLLPVWLSGARDLQELIAARGLPTTDVPVTDSGTSTSTQRDAADRRDSLLVRMQRTVATGEAAEPRPHDRLTDRSLLIHRCHSLSRQAEVLHEALLQAFAEIDDLQPHEVAIVSPCVQKAAPLLEAVFQRTVVGRDRDGRQRTITLPLVVADRGIRETSAAADLLAGLLGLPGSRGSIDDVLAVAGHPLVRTACGIDDDTVATWTDFIERTMIRWGFDADHRRRHGLDLADEADIHTWKLGLERMLLGAMLPDGDPQAAVGGVVPLDDLDAVDLITTTKLARILDLIRTFTRATVDNAPVAAWCDAIERSLVGLCGEECPQLSEPLAHLRRLREAARGTAGGDLPVPFEDVRQLLTAWLDEPSARQPLRTGAITASSMVPLRGVPFRVICVVGYDDGAVGAGEADGDDLAARQQLVGDGDPRADERRALLDCLLAAGERLVITCNGRNVKSNKRVPLVTPLAELVDFAVRHGVAREKFDEASGIEISHPRHQLTRRNFEEAGVEPTGIWSHDMIAAAVLTQVGDHPLKSTDATCEASGGGTGGQAGRSAGVHAAGSTETSGPILTELSLLERMVKDPLGVYLKDTLGVATWREDDEPTPATLPLTLSKRQARLLTLELHGQLILDPTSADSWVRAKQRSGILPVGRHADRQVAELRALAQGLLTGAEGEELNLGTVGGMDLAGVPLGRHRLIGSLQGIHRDVPQQLVYVVPVEVGMERYGRPLHMAGLHLLTARAAGVAAASATVIGRRDEWQLGKRKKIGVRNPEPRPEDPWQTRRVRLAPALLDQAAAASRLDAIAALAHEATRSARPAFNNVLTAAAADREEEFEKALAQDFYHRTAECALFGVSPNFAEVFIDHPARVAFLDAFNRAFQLRHVRAEGGYYELS